MKPLSSLVTANRYTLGNLLLRTKGFLQRQYRINNFLSPLSVPAGYVSSARVQSPVFIVGCGRSGTTMLFNVLAEHPALVPTTGFPDGEDTEFWVRAAGAWMAGIGGVNSRTAVGHCFCLPMTAADSTPLRAAYVHGELLRQYGLLSLPGHRLLNKNPHLSNKLGFVHALFPDARMIHIIRHPYAMIASWKTLLAQYPHLLVEIPDEPDACMNIYPNAGWQNHLPAAHRHQHNFYDPACPNSVRLLARHWRTINASIRRQTEGLDRATCCLVRYEDLLRNQVSTLSLLLDFCGLAQKTTWTLQTKSAGREKWRAQLTLAECAMINEELAVDAPAFGYELYTGAELNTP